MLVKIDDEMYLEAEDVVGLVEEKVFFKKRTKIYLRGDECAYYTDLSLQEVYLLVLYGKPAK